MKTARKVAAFLLELAALIAIAAFVIAIVVQHLVDSL
jgi:hypothetical protein